MQEITSTLGKEMGEQFLELYQEYEEQKTAEAQLVKDFDKLEMIIQAHEYETSQQISLNSFYESTQGKFQNPRVKEWVEELYKRRNKGEKRSKEE